jgi:hypothetical protein
MRRKTFNFKNTTDLLIIALHDYIFVFWIFHACEGQWRSMFQLSCTWLWLVNCREDECIANRSRC